MWAHYVLRTLLTAPSDNRIGNFMKTTKITKLLGAAIAAAVLLLNGCGGGGSGSATPTTPTTPTTPVVTTPTVTLVLTDLTSGATTNSISLGNPVKATATVLDGNKKPVANALVSFEVDPATLVTVSPASAFILSDASGVASVQLSPAAVSSAGAGKISATATIDSTNTSSSVNFSIGAANIGLSDLKPGTTSLSPYSTTNITVNVTDAGVPTSFPVTVEFSSTCASSGKANLTASTQSINGVATANYTDKKCATTDTITATVAGTSVFVTVNLVVSAPQATSIQFIQADPETIVLKGTGSAGFQETSLVKFKVVDNNNQGVANADVKLYLSLTTGGILIDGSATANSQKTAITKQTDANGEVQVSVQSGTIPTPVWVYAEISSTNLLTQSNKLTISTGRPAQDRFSLAVETFNIEGLEYDGVTTAVTARASDRLGNPVPDGTAINFISGGGQIGSSCQTTAGACSVNFRSGNPRLSGNVGIVAYTVGEESFKDNNNNNKYEEGEPFTDIGDAFLNMDGRLNFDVATDLQIIYKAGTSGVCAQAMATSPFAPMVPTTCDLVWGSAHVRQDATIIMSGSQAIAVPQGSTTSANGCVTDIKFLLQDVNANPMPFDTAISALTTNLGTTVISGEKVPNTTSPGGTLHGITLTRALVSPATTCTALPAGSSLSLEVKTPKLIVTPIRLAI
jgi:protocatechuate 3,4-dioxygenase beta subunit